MPESGPILRIRSAVVGREEQVFVLGDRPVSIGRAEDCDIVLLEQSASRHHARIEPSPAGYVLRDLGSPRGVWAAGARVDSLVLRDEASFRIGGTEFVFVEHPHRQPTLMGGRATKDEPSSARAQTPPPPVGPAAIEPPARFEAPRSKPRDPPRLLYADAEPPPPAVAGPPPSVAAPPPSVAGPPRPVAAPPPSVAAPPPSVAAPPPPAAAPPRPASGRGGYELGASRAAVSVYEFTPPRSSGSVYELGGAGSGASDRYELPPPRSSGSVYELGGAPSGAVETYEFTPPPRSDSVYELAGARSNAQRGREPAAPSSSASAYELGPNRRARSDYQLGSEPASAQASGWKLSSSEPGSAASTVTRWWLRFAATVVAAMVVIAALMWLL